MRVPDSGHEPCITRLVQNNKRVVWMATNMSLEIPEDPHEAAAFLEQQLHMANDRFARLCSTFALTEERALSKYTWNGKNILWAVDVYLGLFWSLGSCTYKAWIVWHVCCIQSQTFMAYGRLWSQEDENREMSDKLEFARENVKVLKRGYTEKIDDMQRKLDQKDTQLLHFCEQVWVLCLFLFYSLFACSCVDTCLCCPAQLAQSLSSTHVHIHTPTNSWKPKTWRLLSSIVQSKNSSRKNAWVASSP